MDRAPAALPVSELVLGRYRPLRPLGSGSSGSVWLARDERSGLDVALKIVSRDGKAGARADREAGAAAKLRHPRCQRIYEHANDGRHVYIVYEYVPGATFREATRSGALSDARTVEAAAQVLEGLAHAHARGIVHRDVKPANVLVEEGADVAVRLLDFGLARLADADTLTAAGDVPGTLAYISPERLHGEPASPASDVWSVGVMLWEALAGRHPFWAPSLLATSKKIQTGAPPLAKARPDLPKPLVAAVESALNPDPAQRPSAAQLAQMLRAARRTRRPPAARAVQPVSTRKLSPQAAVAPLLAALFAGWTTSALPFFPTAWPIGLALVAALLTFLSTRGGLAFALAVPILPLGNISLGLALLYAAVAAVWFLLHLRDPRAGLACVLGPLLLPLAALGFLPLLYQPVRRGWRRALGAATAVMLAGLVAGLSDSALPFGAGHAKPLGIDGDRSALNAAGAVIDALGAHPALTLEALILGAAAALLPFALRKGFWGIAAFGAALIGASVLAAPHASPVPAVVTAWLTGIALTLWLTREAWLPRARPLLRRHLHALD